jgi:sugar lactone lactonase YvrE
MAMLAIAITTMLAPGAKAAPLGHEAQALIDRLLAPPVIRPEAGFRARLLIPPGELYDPLFMLPHDGVVWMNDDGLATDGHGSRLLAIGPQGKISVLMGPDKLLLVTGFDLAPASYGNYGGQLFSLSQGTTAMKGALTNHVIQRIDLAAHTTAVFCTLPTAGIAGKGIPGFGADARFGPAGSAFANVFYSTTILNDMIYQTRADGSCKPFADLAQIGAPAGLTFTPDGSAMLATITPGEITAAGKGADGSIVKITADGKVDPKPVATGLTSPLGIAIAPSSFGNYSGQIFVTDIGDIQAPVPQTQALKHDGKVYRVTKDGELKLVAAGFVNPTGLRFIGNHLWVTDINGDFVAGMRELPDGFLVQIDIR